MNKVSLRILVAAAFLVGSALPVAAQVDAIGNLGYNTYSFDWGDVEPFNSGFGGMALVRYWVTDSLAVGAGVDYLKGSGSDSTAVADWVDTDGDGIADTWVTGTGTLEADFSSLGILALVATRLSIGGNVSLEPFGAVGSYGASMKVTVAGESGGIRLELPPVDFEADRQIGFLVGARVGVPVNSNIHLGGTVGYRSVGEFSSGKLESEGITEDVDDMSGFDASGLFAGLALSVTF